MTKRYAIIDDSLTTADDITIEPGDLVAGPWPSASAGDFGALVASWLIHSGKHVTTAVHTLYNSTSAATLTLTDTAPSVSFRCAVTLSSVSGHTDCTGTATVGSETLTFTGAARKLTVTTLTSLPVITTTNIDCNIKVECLTVGGAEVPKETTSTIDCLWKDGPKLYQNSGGAWTQAQATILTQDSTFAIGDSIKFDRSDPTDPTDGLNYTIKDIRVRLTHPLLGGAFLFNVLYL